MEGSSFLYLHEGLGEDAARRVLVQDAVQLLVALVARVIRRRERRDPRQHLALQLVERTLLHLGELLGRQRLHRAHLSTQGHKKGWEFLGNF